MDRPSIRHGIALILALAVAYLPDFGLQKRH